MVSLPDYDANDFRTTPADDRFNRAVTGMYEPGSTFKLQTASMALDDGVVHIWDRIRRRARHPYRPLHDHRFRGQAPLAVSAGGARLFVQPRRGAYRAGRRGGTPARVAEDDGHVRPRRHRAAGGGDADHPAGGGVEGDRDDDRRRSATASRSRRCMWCAARRRWRAASCGSPTILALAARRPAGRRAGDAADRPSDMMRKLMRLVVTDGFGKQAEVAGYYPGGKTGTAEKVGAHGYKRGFKESFNVAAFTSVFPMNAPRYAVYMMLDEPHGNKSHVRLFDGGLGGRAGGRTGDRAHRRRCWACCRTRRMRRRSMRRCPFRWSRAGRPALWRADRQRPLRSMAARQGRRGRRPSPGLTILPATIPPRRGRSAHGAARGGVACRHGAGQRQRFPVPLRLADIMRQVPALAGAAASAALTAWRARWTLPASPRTAGGWRRASCSRRCRAAAWTAARSSPMRCRAARWRCWRRRAPRGRLACRRGRCWRIRSRGGGWRSSRPGWPAAQPRVGGRGDRDQRQDQHGRVPAPDLGRRAARSAASLGTLGLMAPGFEPGPGLTTPDPVSLAETLARLARAGVQHAAMEASSHGLDQFRLDGVRLAAAAFTNLTRDHLDYHGVDGGLSRGQAAAVRRTAARRRAGRREQRHGSRRRWRRCARSPRGGG